MGFMCTNRMFNINLVLAIVTTMFETTGFIILVFCAKCKNFKKKPKTPKILTTTPSKRTHPQIKQQFTTNNSFWKCHVYSIVYLKKLFFTIKSSKWKYNNVYVYFTSVRFYIKYKQVKLSQLIKTVKQWYFSIYFLDTRNN